MKKNRNGSRVKPGMTVLLLGSGAIKIGQAGEFDYSGSQAIKALKESGLRVVLINPNIATIQTSEGMADEVYFLPVTPASVTSIIKKEKPEAIMLAFGGQTALNCGVALSNQGILIKYGVVVWGTPVKSIELTEDRQLFAKHLQKLHIPVPISKAARTLASAIKIAHSIGYPIMVRAAYALGGQKSGVVRNETELISKVNEALAFSPQVLIEQYLYHYKEIEYEVVRDRAGNCLTVCNMENFDPLGIHTGESIVVAPSQTLTSREYHLLREVSIKIVQSLKIVGECNVQFAVNPNSGDDTLDFKVIEVNARLSRSSALASKATGYPLAYVAAKLALGSLLHEVPNQITKVTTACSEPALDYVAVKVPKWDLNKFVGVNQALGSSMKSVGEVMAIGRSFEEAIQKAVRMLDEGLDGVTDGSTIKEAEIARHLSLPTTQRLYAVVAGLRRGQTVDELHDITGIDPWFLARLKAIVLLETALIQDQHLTEAGLRDLKRFGFSDKRIAILLGKIEIQIRNKRQKWGILPSVFQIDTLAGEYPAETNYLYMTYGGNHHDVVPLGKRGVVVLGSGPYRIGSSVEFDWTAVHTVKSLKDRGVLPIVINCNPETVSTDYDISSRLYFEELSLERVLDIYEFEQPEGLIISVGGQTANNLAPKLSGFPVTILGTRLTKIDQAEDRNKFSKLLDTLSIRQPKWNSFATYDQAQAFAETVGYPVLVRPSYVLSGSAMKVCFGKSELSAMIQSAQLVSKEHPVLITQFMVEAEEIEYDAVAQAGEIKLFAISEHLEHGGIHSGDATIIYPPQKIYVETERQIRMVSEKLIRALQITGPINIQFLARDNQVYVIEANLRASRTFPLVSKAIGVNFAEVLVDSLYGEARDYRLEYPGYVVVKVPQFSFAQLEGADPTLTVEMASTGEAAAFGDTVPQAYLSALLSVGLTIPKKGIFISLGGLNHKVRMLEAVMQLATLGLPLYATEKTTRFLRKNGIKAKLLYKIHERKTPNALTCFQKKQVDLVINLVDMNVTKEVNDDYVIRRAAIDHNIPLVTNMQQAKLMITALVTQSPASIVPKSWSDYLKTSTIITEGARA